MFYINIEKKLTVSLLLSLIPFFLTAQALKPDSSLTVALRIDPANAVGATVSDLFSEVEFIPLETTKKSLFGNINNLQIIDSHFVFDDLDTRSVYIFTLQGKFRAKIDANKMYGKNNRGDANSFQGFTVAKAEGSGKIGIYTEREVLYFDLDAKLTEKKLLSGLSKADRALKTYFSSPNAYIELQHFDETAKDSIFYELITADNGQVTGRYFPFEKTKFQNDMYVADGTGLFDYGVENSRFFTRPHDYNLYLASPQGLRIAYRLLLPFALSLPGDFLTAAQYRNKRIQYLAKNDKKIFGLGNTYLTGNNLFFQTYQFESNKSLKNALVYNLKTQKLVSISDLRPDLLSQFLPVTDAGTGYDFRKKGFQLYHDGNLYTCYSSLVLFSIKEQAAAKNTVYSKALSDLFKSGDRKSNPVIIRLKPRTD